MRRFLLATTACLALGGLTATARAQGENVAMAIVLDSSDSVGLQGTQRLIDAHVALFSDARLAPFLARQGINSLAVSAFTFGSDGAGTQDIVRQLTSWQVINSAATATAFANSLNNAKSTGAVGGGRSVQRCGAR